MATSRFSLTLFWPMNSCKRCGRSLSSKEESSSTGAAETRRSLRCRLGLSLAADTRGDGSSSEFWVLGVGRTLLSAEVGTHAGSCLSLDLSRTGVSAPHHLLPNHPQAHALQLGGVEPGDLLAEPGFGAGEFVLLGCRCEVARGEQVGDRGLAKLAEPVREPTSTRRSGQNHGLAGEVCEFAEVFLRLGQGLGPAVSFAEQGNRRIQVVDTEDDALDAGNRRTFDAGRSLDAPGARRLVFDDEWQR